MTERNEENRNANAGSGDKSENRRFFSFAGLGCTAVIGVEFLIEYGFRTLIPGYDPTDIGKWFLLSFCGYLLALAAGAVVLRLAWGAGTGEKSVGEVGSGKAFLFAVPFSALFIYVASSLSMFFTANSDSSADTGALPSDAAGAAVFFVVSVLILPLAEEFFFRKMLAGGIADRGGALAVFFSAAVYALSRQDAEQIPTSFAIGLVLGAAYIISKKLWVPIAVHAVVNLFWVFLPAMISSFAVDAEGIAELNEIAEIIASSGVGDEELIGRAGELAVRFLPYVILSGLLSAVTMGLVVAGVVLMIVRRGKIALPSGTRPVSRSEIGDTVFLSPGVAIFFIAGTVLTVLSFFSVI